MDRKHLLPGEFGAAARLSPKALRLYAEQGLLVPASVDPVTGYRSYSPDQLPRARLIARLRALGLPLGRIAFLADLTPDARELELRGWLRTQRKLLDESAAVIEAVSVTDTALVDAVALRDVHIRLVPAHAEAFLPVPERYEDFPLILRVYDAVEAWTDARPGVTCTGHPYEIYPGTGARFDVAYPVVR